MTSLAHRVSGQNRDRKWKLFVEKFKPSPTTTVLDAGFSDAEFSPLDNYIERFYPHPQNLTALGIDEPREFRRRYPQVTAVTYPGRRFPFEDRQFDIVWSNAVIEHVGDFDRQVEFLSEIRRVGRRAFVTTPNRFFPVEVHTRVPFLHWLPKPLFDRLLHRMGKGFAAGDYMHLSSKARFCKTLRDAGVSDFEIHENKLLGFTIDFVAVF